MKVLVAIKRVVDYNVRVRARADGSDVDIANVKMSINPFDEHAVEEAVRLKEKGLASEVVVVACGTAAAQDVLRHALAMGADRAVLVECTDAIQPWTQARLLRAVQQQEQAALILLGKQAIDDDAAEAAQMLAGLLGVAQATFASRIDVLDGRVTVVREIDGGQETLALSLPAVISCDLRLNEPRYVKLPNLMQAKKKTIATLSAAQLGVDTGGDLQLVQVAEPPPRTPGVRVGSVGELLDKLKEAKVLQ